MTQKDPVPETAPGFSVQPAQIWPGATCSPMDSPRRHDYPVPMRAFLALLLSLVLTLASQTEAVARSEMAGASDLVLCGAEGPVALTLDAAGHPVTMRSCTHCLAAGLVADLPHPVILPRPVARFARLHPAQITAPAPAVTITPSARAPPSWTV